MVRLAFIAVLLALISVLLVSPAASAPPRPAPQTQTATVTTNHNTFVADPNLTGWEWRVRAQYSGSSFGNWTTPAPFRFHACRLQDGTPCRVPPQ